MYAYRRSISGNSGVDEKQFRISRPLLLMAVQIKRFFNVLGYAVHSPKKGDPGFNLSISFSLSHQSLFHDASFLKVPEGNIFYKAVGGKVVVR